MKARVKSRFSLTARTSSRALLALLAFLVAPDEAHARRCGGNVVTQCFHDHSGYNHSVFGIGPGIVCAATTPIITPGGENYNWDLLCYKPSGALGILQIPQPPNTTTMFRNTSTLRIKALAIQGSPDLQKGPFTLWALRMDGKLFKATGDSRFRDSRDFPSNFTQITGAPTNIVLQQLAVVQPTWSALAFPTANTASGGMYALDGSSWQIAAAAGSYFRSYGGPLGELAIVGRAATGKTLSLLYWGLPSNIPAIPANVTLSRSDTNFHDLVTTYNKETKVSAQQNLGQTLPIALGLEDAWLMSSSSDMNTRIHRSTLGANGWSAWATYPTGEFSDFDRPPQLQWSIADARSFRGKRGELMLVGDNWHLVSYIP